ncbi:hypothetical protein B0H14DRAFT_3154808 [Mycena olivaceomarginata]|nr:hypothetical protein B0H14DRAFT_3154808 [Mycena olivaceomarginata]
MAIRDERCHKFKGNESYLGQKHPQQAAEAEVEVEAKASMDITLRDSLRYINLKPRASEGVDDTQPEVLQVRVQVQVVIRRSESSVSKFAPSRFIRVVREVDPSKGDKRKRSRQIFLDEAILAAPRSAVQERPSPGVIRGLEHAGRPSRLYVFACVAFVVCWSYVREITKRAEPRGGENKIRRGWVMEEGAYVHYILRPPRPCHAHGAHARVLEASHVTACGTHIVLNAGVDLLAVLSGRTDAAPYVRENEEGERTYLGAGQDDDLARAEDEETTLGLAMRILRRTRASARCGRTCATRGASRFARGAGDDHRVGRKDKGRRLGVADARMMMAANHCTRRNNSSVCQKKSRHGREDYSALRAMVLRSRRQLTLRVGRYLDGGDVLLLEGEGGQVSGARRQWRAGWASDTVRRGGRGRGRLAIAAVVDMDYWVVTAQGGRGNSATGRGCPELLLLVVVAASLCQTTSRKSRPGNDYSLRVSGEFDGAKRTLPLL